MTVVKEKIGNGYIDEEGDLKPYADVEPYLDHSFTDNASIAQGMSNLQSVHSRIERDRQLEEEAIVDARSMRERMIAEQALSAAGPYETFEEHAETQRRVVDFASDVSMYKGGEKGGYQTEDFIERYKEKAPRVEKGARKNHIKLVHKTFPELMKASRLIEAGFSTYDVGDMVNAARHEVEEKLGGPANEAARSKLRASLKHK